ncbi:MAG: hypothetical protein FWG12_04190 [Holophagaceae bacterium]|nr:hypothetical protein [Holophagaceae bacterium]
MVFGSKFQRFAVPAAILLAFNLTLSSQTAFESGLTRNKGNKIVLLGEWKAPEATKWREIIKSDGIYEHDFTLLDRSNFAYLTGNRNELNFESWFRQRYDLSNAATWAALDLENKLIVSGIQTPEAKEFDQMLERRGVRSPLRKVRDFLQENPDHIDAKTDLLKEVRRRALHAMPERITEDLDDEADLRTWAVMAAEADRVFSGSWLGVDLNFFRPDQGQPEKYSKLMRRVFAKHVTQIESAIRLEPANNALWNIWAWMAQNLPDYKWDVFIDSLEPIFFPKDGILHPSAEVCAWLVSEFRLRSDWQGVLKFARMARRFNGSSISLSMEWMPHSGNNLSGAGSATPGIEGFPAKSAYAPHIEALLRLGDIEGANEVFDEMIRIAGKNSFDAHRSNNAMIVAGVARSLGMEELAKLWEQGEQVTKVPYLQWFIPEPPPLFILSHVYPYSKESDPWLEFYKLLPKLSPPLKQFGSQTTSPVVLTLGWHRDDGPKWGLIGADHKLLAEGLSVPKLDELQDVLNRFNIRSDIDICRQHLAEGQDQPGIDLYYAFAIIKQHIEMAETDKSTLAGSEQNEVLWAEAARHLRRVLSEHPDVLINCPHAYPTIAGYIIEIPDVSIKNSLLKPLSGPFLTNIESLLERKPSSTALWTQWFFWRIFEDTPRQLDALVERIKISPLSRLESVLPHFAMDIYYKECQEEGNWPKLIALLKPAWERETFRIIEAKIENPDYKVPDFRAVVGNVIGIPLMEAYLNDNKPQDADGVFNTWLDCGGTFTDLSGVIELAKSKGQELLAREWERRAGNREY